MKLSILLFFVVLPFSGFSQVKTYTTFPILADSEKPLWKEYEKAKNVKVENDSSFSFDLKGNHFKITAYPNGVKNKKIVKSELTKNKNDKDSIIETRFFLVPSDYIEQKVLIVQVSYIYEKASGTFKEFWMVPLMFFRDINDARKEYKISQ